ncbi:MAG: serine acetyltransferase [Acidobacteriota bacterium]
MARTTDIQGESPLFETSRSLAQLIREDWTAHFCDWTQPGFRALAVYRFGIWVQQLRWRPIRVVLRRVHTTLFRFVRNRYGLEIPVTAVVGRRVVFGHQAGIVIHANAVIGDDCFLRQNVTLGASNAERSEQAPTLGRGVSVGCGAVILGGVTIGDRSQIGPNTVVMMDVPADTTVFPHTPRMVTLPNRPATIDQGPNHESRASRTET